MQKITSPMEVIGSCEATHVSYCKTKTHVVRGATNNVVFVDLMGLALPIPNQANNMHVVLSGSVVGRCSKAFQPRTTNTKVSRGLGADAKIKNDDKNLDISVALGSWH